MPFFGGFARALGENIRYTQEDNARKAAADADREDRILQHLATSDDPEIASLALTGLMSGVQRKPAKGIKGWLGEMQGNPSLPTIRSLIDAGRQVETPDMQAEPGSMALPPQSPVEQGAPPVRDVEGEVKGRADRGAPQGLFGGVPTVRQDQPPMTTQWQPRQVFLTPAERIQQEQEATITGRLQAYRKALELARTPEEKALIMGTSGNPQRRFATTPGQIVLPGGVKIAGHYDPDSDQLIDATGQIRTDAVDFIRAGVAPNNPATGQFRTTDKDGTVHVFSADGTEIATLPGAGKPQIPPPDYSGNATIDTDAGPTVVRTPRTGGGTVVGPAVVPPSQQEHPEQALAKGVVAAVNQAVSESRIAGLPVEPGKRDAEIAKHNQKYNKQWTWEQWVAQANSPTPIDAVAPPPSRGAAPTRGRGRTGRTPTTSSGTALPPPSQNARDPLGVLTP